MELHWIITLHCVLLNIFTLSYFSYHLKRCLSTLIKKQTKPYNFDYDSWDDHVMLEHDCLKGSDLVLRAQSCSDRFLQDVFLWATALTNIHHLNIYHNYHLGLMVNHKVHVTWVAFILYNSFDISWHYRKLNLIHMSLFCPCNMFAPFVGENMFSNTDEILWKRLFKGSFVRVYLSMCMKAALKACWLSAA